MKGGENKEQYTRRSAWNLFALRYGVPRNAQRPLQGSIALLALKPQEYLYARICLGAHYMHTVDVIGARHEKAVKQ